MVLVLEGQCHQSRMSMDLRFLVTMVLLTSPAAVELSVWTGDLGCGQPILVRDWRMGTISLS